MTQISKNAWIDIRKVLNKHNIPYTTSYNTTEIENPITKTSKTTKDMNIQIGNICIANINNDFDNKISVIPCPVDTVFYRIYIKSFIGRGIIKKYCYVNSNLYFEDDKGRLINCDEFNKSVFLNPIEAQQQLNKIQKTNKKKG